MLCLLYIPFAMKSIGFICLSQGWNDHTADQGLANRCPIAIGD